MTFSEKILEWYGQNKRSLPWRNTLEPYKIWLSEVMLQQTRVSQGLPYYHKFLKAFPTVHDLAEAKEEKVLKLWQGLGYYSRARNLHAAAKMVVASYKGHFPNTYEELLKLPGVGDYTASAVASICFNKPEPVVDGNVYRVLARYFGVYLPINSTEGTKTFKELARKVMSVTDIRDYNQGIMEFGSMQCTPQNPGCRQCTLQISCVAFSTNSVAELPVKFKKKTVKKRYFNYLFVRDFNGNTLLNKRQEKGIWKHLYEFPLVESNQEIDLKELKDKLQEKAGLKGDVKVSLLNGQPIVHKLSHQHLYTRFWEVVTKEQLVDGIRIEDLEKYPMPVLMSNFIETLKNS